LFDILRKIEKWKSAKFVSYGDSITQQGNWQPYVANYFDMQHFNRGVGGSAFTVGHGVQSYWMNEADNTYNSPYHTGDIAPSGAVPMEASFISDKRIETIPEDADLIIIAGGTNDHGTSSPMGECEYEMSDGVPVFDTSTFKGAVCHCVYKIMEAHPNAVVMLQTPPNTRPLHAEDGINALGLSMLDYAKAIKECAEFMSIPCIDVYANSGINQFNLALYGDNLHPDDLGGRKMAQVVIEKLKGYEKVSDLF
jgi:lysophospholipase L1-like esterase